MTAPSNPYANRWRWWYPAIADWMISHPDGTLTDCAKELGKALSTISMITNTDLFKDYLRQRRRDWEARHDHALRVKTTKVAELGLDILAESLEKKRGSVPINTLSEITMSALDRLGYSPNKPASTVQINNVQQGAAVVMPVNADALLEAQEAIRVAQARRAAASALPPTIEGELLNVNRTEPVEQVGNELGDDDIVDASGVPPRIGEAN